MVMERWVGKLNSSTWDRSIGENEIIIRKQEGRNDDDEDDALSTDTFSYVYQFYGDATRQKYAGNSKRSFSSLIAFFSAVNAYAIYVNVKVISKLMDFRVPFI